MVLDYGTTMKAPTIWRSIRWGRPPAITDRGVTVTEGAAVCTYLTDAVPEAGLPPALSDPARGTCLRWMFFAAARTGG